MEEETDRKEDMEAGEKRISDSLISWSDGYEIEVRFGKEDGSAKDAIRHYLRQMAQLKY